MRVAVFTSQFPARASTFFERDMRALLEAGLELDVFPIYPLDPALWSCTQQILGEAVLPRSRVHHLGGSASIRSLRPWPVERTRKFVGDSVAAVASALPWGLDPVAKTAYILPKAWAWAQDYGDRFDHVLAYWGNYAAT